MAIATTPTTTGSPDALRARHHAAASAKATAHAALAAATQQRDHLLHALRPHDDAPSLDRRERLRAEIEVRQIDEKIEVLQVAADSADDDEAAARLALQAAVDVEVHQRRRQIVSALARALLAARPHADALSLLHLQHPFTGDQLLWPSLQSRTTHFESVLTSWLAAMANYDLLDAETLALVRKSEAGDLLPAA
jgi:hypothetical protein